jgi:hypothetical protein
MIDHERIKDFWAQWQHEPDARKEFVRFKTRVTEVAREIWQDYIQRHKSNEKAFARISGTAYTGDSYAKGTPFSNSGLLQLLNSAKALFEIAQAIQFLLWTLEEINFGLKTCCDKLETAFDNSPTIMIRVVLYGDTAMLYPSGARLLDEAAVESNLIWLARYPQALKPFTEALKAYMSKDVNQHRNMLDNLRFSVEQILRIVLNNEKSLENQKEEFLRWLKHHDAHNQIAGMYHELLFNHFAKYQNDAVKHREDKYTPAEVEFVLYATGTFLRFIQRLNEQPAVIPATANHR